MQNFKKNIKLVLPNPVLRFLTGFFYGWYGSYLSWELAKKKATGYDSQIILDKVKHSLLQVKEGKAVYERDSVLFNEVEYSYPFLLSLMWVAARSNGKLNVLDFGGSLGSSYYQNVVFLDSIKEVNWCIVEQPNFVKAGKEDFANDRLHFFSSIEECVKSYNIDVVILSSVLQYLEEPYVLIDKINSLEVKNVLVDRTPFVKYNDRITIQKVNPKIYKGSYPCWFFSKDKFLKKFSSSYDLMLEYDAIDRANIKSEFKGFLFKRK